MDSRKNKNVLAVAIAPKFAYAILAGKKSVEFRRNGAPTNISHIVLYSTKPDQKVIGYCKIRECIVASPSILWQEFGKYGGIDKDDFNSYYEGRPLGKCYIIEKSFEFVQPILLSNCKSFKSAPQSYVYMAQFEWENLTRKKKRSANHWVELSGSTLLPKDHGTRPAL